MATPHVSGLIAIMLGIDDNLDLDDIRELLRTNSELRGDPTILISIHIGMKNMVLES